MFARVFTTANNTGSMSRSKETKSKALACTFSSTWLPINANIKNAGATAAMNMLKVE